MIKRCVSKQHCFVTPNYCKLMNRLHSRRPIHEIHGLDAGHWYAAVERARSAASRPYVRQWEKHETSRKTVYFEMINVYFLLIEGIDRWGSQTFCGSSINARTQCLCLAGKKAPWRHWQETGAIVEFPRCRKWRNFCSYEVSKIHRSGPNYRDPAWPHPKKVPCFGCWNITQYNLY